jgi:predicted dehydrogenase
MDYYNQDFKEQFGIDVLPTYLAADFDRMIADQKPDCVIVTTMDRTHHKYIIRAMELGCDVISEKPMTTDVEKCRQILDAVEQTGQQLRVTFNYRYAPIRTKVKELLLQGVIGEVRAVHFEWLLDTQHGADYFRRWHRDKRNSGGLMVHKATHHFDLVNWWLASSPETVFGFGNLGFYGRLNAENRGEPRPYVRATNSEAAKDDPFAMDLRSSDMLKGLYLDAELDSGYQRDQNVFGDGISIDDTMNVLVRYRSGTQMSYSLNAYSPWEGYRVCFTGTRGRIECEQVEKSYVNAKDPIDAQGADQSSRLTVQKHWEAPYDVPIPVAEGGHGGGDKLLLEDMFGVPREDPFGQAANHIDGARSILTGIAANRSFETGLPVRVDDLMKLPDPG